jgi:hypothetical protein
MNKTNSVIMLLCFIIFLQFISNVERQPMVMHTKEYVTTADEKVIIGNNAIKKKHLERLVNTIASTPKTKAFAERFGVVVEKVPQEYVNANKDKMVFDDGGWRTRTNETTNTKVVDYTMQRIMEEVEEFFRRNKGFARQCLNTYLRNKNDPEFWDSVRKFVDEN